MTTLLRDFHMRMEGFDFMWFCLKECKNGRCACT